MPGILCRTSPSAHPSVAGSEMYYRYSLFQQSPDPSTLAKPHFGSGDREARTPPTSAASRYKLKRSPPVAFGRPPKRSSRSASKPSTNSALNAWRSLAQWSAEFLFDAVSYGEHDLGEEDSYFSSILESVGTIIYLEMLRMEMPARLVIAALWYAKRAISVPFIDRHGPVELMDIESIIHHLFMICACLAHKTTSDQAIPIMVWTQNLGDAKRFCAMESATLQTLNFELGISKSEWQKWTDYLARHHTLAHSYSAFSEHTIRLIIETLV